MFHRSTALALVALLFVACDSGNPVAPQVPEAMGPGEVVTVSVSASPSRLEAGALTPATVTIQGRQAGSPVADGTVANLSTNLGHFGLDESGKPRTTTSVRLAGGLATLPFHASDEPGTATLLAQVGTSIGRLSLAVVAPLPKPVADFTFEVDGLAVLFSDQSTGDPRVFEWTFGDGNGSNQRNPLHRYAVPGTYTVSLSVASASGAVATKSKFVAVGVSEPLIADFKFQVNVLDVLFTDQSIGEPISWFWRFGDGKTSSERNPRHAFPRSGTFTTELTVTNTLGLTARVSQFVTVSLGDPPQADFQFRVDGLRVQFFDASTGAPSRWAWDFGDGTTSDQQNPPAHLYSTPGTYNVRLEAGNLKGSTTKSQLVTVAPGVAPEADFEDHANGLTVVFLDRSRNQPTSWVWRFGDGTESTVQNPPAHTYPGAGSYTVVLTATNGTGSGTASKVIELSSVTLPTARFCYQRNGLTVIFQDQSPNSPTSWLWNFGDCESQGATCQSAIQNPGHAYLSAGTYAVSLTVANSAGPSSLSKLVIVDPGLVDFVCQ